MRAVVFPSGPPLTCGWVDGVAVWFDGAGLPHDRANVQQALAFAQGHRDTLARSLDEIDRGQAMRRAIIARLEALEARGE